MSPTGRLKARYVCPECKGIFRPLHKEQIVCARPCDLKRRRRLGLYKGFGPESQKKAVETRRARLKEKYAREFAHCKTLAEAWTAGYKRGYHIGTPKAYRRGYAAGWSACAGEMKETA